MSTATSVNPAGVGARRRLGAKTALLLATLIALGGYGYYVFRAAQAREVAAPKPDPLLMRLTALESRMDRNAALQADLQRSLTDVQRKLDQLLHSLSSIGADTTALRERAEHAPTPAPVAVPAKPAQRPVASRPTRPARPVAAAPEQPESARVLGVDSWNGQAVVAVSAGGKIEFLRDGDSVGDAVLQSADAAKQHATFARHRKAPQPQRLAQTLNKPDEPEVAP